MRAGSWRPGLRPWAPSPCPFGGSHCRGSSSFTFDTTLSLSGLFHRPLLHGYTCSHSFLKSVGCTLTERRGFRWYNLTPRVIMFFPKPSYSVWALPTRIFSEFSHCRQTGGPHTSPHPSPPDCPPRPTDPSLEGPLPHSHLAQPLLQATRLLSWGSKEARVCPELGSQGS